MKKIRKVTRVKLQIDQINDFILLGLVSTEPDYKLSLALNRELGISLKNGTPLKISGNSGEELLFSRFSDTTESPDRVYDLVANRSGKNYLIKKLKNVDYILHVHYPDNEIFTAGIISRLREMTSITAVFNIDKDSIKDRNLNFVIQ